MSNLIHVWSDTLGESLDSSTERRNAFARNTWDKVYQTGNWISCRFSEKAAKKYGRTSRVFGDTRSMPFIRDMINFAATLAADDNDIIVLTNADICFVPDITKQILTAVEEHGSACGTRWNFQRLTTPIVSLHVLKSGEWFAGTDIFCFTVKWWNDNKENFPDMVLGCECWDLVFRNLIRITKGVDLPYAIYHETHKSYWFTNGRLTSNPGNLHNRKLSRRWFDENKKLGADEFDWQKEMEARKPKQQQSEEQRIAHLMSLPLSMRTVRMHPRG